MTVLLLWRWSETTLDRRRQAPVSASLTLKADGWHIDYKTDTGYTHIRQHDLQFSRSYHMWYCDEIVTIKGHAPFHLASVLDSASPPVRKSCRNCVGMGWRAVLSQGNLIRRCSATHSASRHGPERPSLFTPNTFSENARGGNVSLPPHQLWPALVNRSLAMSRVTNSRIFTPRYSRPIRQSLGRSEENP